MLLLSAGLGFAAPGALWAAPEGGRVLQGEGEISYEEEGRRTVVRQSGNNLVVDWDRFDVGTEESVHFAQPGRNASVLNRIFDTKPSEIYGSLTAQGRVWLVNGHGVYFAPGSQVNVSGLVASSLDVDPGEFMSGRYVLKRRAGSPLGRVVNRGLLEAARGGFVGLAGSEVINEGLIYAQAGRIELATGERIEVVDFDGDGLLGFAVQEGVLAGSGKVENSGELHARGGEVYLKGSVAREVLEGVVNNSGVIRANRVSRRGGKIVLEGVGGGVLNSGKLEVSGESGERGGEVKLSGEWVSQEGEIEASGEQGGGRIALKAKGLLGIEGVLQVGASEGKGGTLVLEGDRVRLGGGSELDASGAFGGGRIYLGGGRQGQDAEIENARHAEVEEGAILRADARVKGDGGEVIVWAEEKTSYRGSISARGGEEGGDGGFAEVSAKWLQYNGAVDLRAPRGKAGKLLLDPVNVRICDDAVSGCTQATPNTFTDATITTMLANGDLEISTDFSGSEEGNITIEDAVVIAWPNSARTLTLTAANNILLNGTLTGNSVANSTLNLNFGGTLDFSGLDAPATDISNLSLRAAGSASGSTLKGLTAYTVLGVNSGVLPTGGGAAGSENWRFSGVRTLEGTAGADTFNLNADLRKGEDLLLQGGGGDDIFNVRAYFKGQIFGGAGEDTFNLDATIEGSYVNTISGGEGNDIFNIGENGDVLIPNDSGGFVGGIGNDIFNIKGKLEISVNVPLRGNEGNDSFRIFENVQIRVGARVAFDGGGGTDDVRIMDGNAVYSYEIRGNAHVLTPGEVAYNGLTSVGFVNLEEIYGGSGADNFFFNSALNVEKVDGGGGTDTLRVGGNTASTYTVGSSGNTLAQGGTTVLTFSNIENLEGGGGADTFNIEVAHVGNLRGGNGDDIFNLSGLLRGNIEGGAGADQFNFLVVAGCLVSGSGSCGSNAALVNGGAGSDTVSVQFDDAPVKVTFRSLPAVPGADGYSGSIERVASGTSTEFTRFTGINRINGDVGQASANELSVATGLRLTHDEDNLQVVYSAVSPVNLVYSNFGVFSDFGTDFSGLDLSGASGVITVELTGVDEGGFDGSYTIAGGTAIPFVDMPGVLGRSSEGDTLRFSIAGNEVVTFTVLGDRQGNLSVALAGQEQIFTFEAIENLVGSNSAADVFIFSEAGGLGTGGTVDGRNGADSVRFSGSSGVTYSTSTNGNTMMRGSTLLTGFSNVESLEGGSGADTFNIGTVLSGSLAGGGGADSFVFSAAGGVASVDGGADRDTLSTTGNVAYTYTVVGGDGSTLERGGTTVATFSNIEVLAGGDGADTFNIRSNVEGLSGGGGADIFIFSEDGSVMEGGSLRTIDGGADRDTLRVTGDRDHEYSVGESSNSLRRGGSTLALFSNIEVLEGGDGADAFNIGAAYAGDLRGGAGADVFFFTDSGAVNNVDGGAGTDLLSVSGNTPHTFTVASGGNRLARGGTKIADFSNVENMEGENGVDTFNIEAAHTGNLRGGEGNDIFNISGLLRGNIEGNAGDDQFNFLAVGGCLVSGSGICGSNAASVAGGAGSDTVNVQFANNPVKMTLLELPEVNGYSGSIERVASGTLTAFTRFTGINTINGNVAQASANEIEVVAGLNLSHDAGTKQILYTEVSPNRILTYSNFSLFSGFGLDFSSLSDAVTVVLLEVNTGGGFNGRYTIGGTTTSFVGTSSVQGGSGGDTLRFSIAGNEVATFTVSGDSEGSLSFGQQSFAFNSIENLAGRDSAADVFVFGEAGGLGTGGTVDGGSGADSVRFSGTSGVTYSTSTNGNTMMRGNTLLTGFSNVESLEGGSGADTFNIETVLSGSLRGGGGADSFVFSATGGAASVDGGADSDTLRATGTVAYAYTVNSGGNTLARGGTTVAAFSNIEDLEGGDGADTFNIQSGVGDLSGGGGADIFIFSATGDAGSIDGGADRDTLRATGTVAYAYTVSSGGNTLARGGTTVAAFSNVEDLEGGAGADTFTIEVAHTGNLVGGAGADTFVFSDSGDVEAVDGGAATDTLRVTGGTAHTYTVASAGNTLERGDTTIADFSNVEDLAGDRGNDIFNIEIAHTGVLSGRAGADEFNLAAVVTGRLDGGQGVGEFPDTFTLQSGAGVRRAVGGGNAPLLSSTNGSLIYQGWSDPVTVTLSGYENSIGFSGTATGLMVADGSNLEASGFSGISNLNVGGTSTSDTLQGIDLASGESAAFDLFLDSSNNVAGNYSHSSGIFAQLDFQGIDVVRGGSGEGEDEVTGAASAVRYELEGIGQGRVCLPRCDGDDPKGIWSFSGIESVDASTGTNTLALRVDANTAEAWVLLGGELPDTFGFQGSVEVAATQSAPRSLWMKFRNINEVIGASGAGRNVLRNELMPEGSPRVPLEDRSGTTAGSGSIRHIARGYALSYTGFGERQLFVLDLGSLGAAVTVTLSGRDTEGYSGRYSTSDVSGSFTKSLGVRGRTAEGDTLITELTGASAWNVAEAGNSYNNGGLIYHFFEMENLQGGVGVDTFNIQAAHVGDLLGGAGADIFVFSDSGDVEDVDGGADTDILRVTGNSAYSYTVASSGNTLTLGTTTIADFSNVEDLEGGDGADTFNIQATHAGNLRGGGGNDIFNLSGLLRGNIEGGAGSDQFNFQTVAACLVSGSGECGSSAAGLVDGGEDSGDVVSVGFNDDPVRVTFRAAPVAAGYSGRIHRLEANTPPTEFARFAGINTINGHSDQAANNEFSVGNGLALTRDLGTSQVRYAAVDPVLILGYSNFDKFGQEFNGLDLSTYSEAVTVELTAVDGGGFDGSYAIAGGTAISFVDMAGVRGGSGGDTLRFSIAGNEVVTFTVSGDSEGELSVGLAAQERIFSFEAIENLMGSDSAADVFVFSEAGGLGTGGTVDGRSGADSVRFTGTSGVTYSTSTNGNTMMRGSTLLAGFSNVERLEGGSGADTFNIETVLSGSLTGRGGADSFVFSATGGAASVDGGADSDTLRATGNVAYSYTVSDSGNRLARGGTTVADFSNIENLEGGAGADTFAIQAALAGDLRGGAGADTFAFSGSGDVESVDGGEGTDTLSVTGNTAHSYTVASGGNRLARGGTTIAAFSNVENLEGGGGADTFDIQAAHTGNLRGGAGADTFVFSDSGDVDEVDGGADTDTLSVTGNSAYSYTIAGGGNRLARGGTTVAAFSNVENLEGGGGADTFNIEAAHAGNLRGGAGADTFVFSDAGDVEEVDGGAGTDILSVTGNSAYSYTVANGGNTLARGGTTVAAFSNVEDLQGGAGADTFVFSGAGDVEEVDGGAGTDILRVTGNSAYSYTVASGGNTLAQGGTTIAAFSNVENLEGGGGADTFDIQAAHTGNLRGGAGADTFVFSDSGDVDEVDGGADTDTLSVTGNSAYSYTVAGGGNRLVRGGTTVAAFSNVENLEGGGGADTFNIEAAHAGNLRGGAGADTFVFSDAGDVEELDGGAGTDILSVTGNSAYSYTVANGGNTLARGGTTVAAFSNVENLEGGGGADTFVFSGAGDVEEVDGGAGTDILRVTGNSAYSYTVASGGNTLAQGGTTIAAFSNVENLEGGAGADTFVFSDSGDVEEVDGGAGTDILRVTGNSAHSYTVASSGNTLAREGTTIAAFSNVENLQGGDGADTFNMEVAHTGDLRGGEGNDIFNLSGLLRGNIEGNAGDDQFNFLVVGGCLVSGSGICGSNAASVAGGAGSDVVSVQFGDNPVKVTLPAVPEANGYSGGIERVASGTSTEFTRFTGINTINGDVDQASANEIEVATGLSLENNAVDSEIRYAEVSPERILAYSNFGRLAGLGLDFSGLSDAVTVELTAVNTGGGFDGSYTIGDTTTSFLRSSEVLGGSGEDTLRFSVTGNVGATFTVSGDSGGSLSSGQGSFAFQSIENLVGSDSAADVFVFGEAGGLGSGGTVDGRSLADSVRFTGTSGVTYSTSTNGNTMMRGSTLLTGFSNVESLEGGSGADTFNIETVLSGSLTGGGGTDSFVFSATGGAASVDGGGGVDTLRATGNVAYSYTVVGSSGNRLARGDTTVADFSNIEDLAGGDGADTFNIQSDVGDLAGGGGADIFIFSATGDAGSIDGGADRDTLRATGNVAYSYTVNSGGNTLARGDTTVAAFSNVEDLEGGAGADTFTIQVALAGNLVGGAGADTFVFSDSGDVEEVDGGADTDSLRVTGNTAHSYTVASAGNTLERGDTTVAAFSNVEDLEGGAGADTFSIQVALAGNLVGGAGADTFVFSGSGDVENVDGGEGTDILSVTGNTAHSYTVASAGNTLERGDTTVAAFSNVEDLQGGAGADTFVFSGAGDVENIDGGEGTDILRVTGNTASTYTVASGGNTLAQGGTTIAAFSNVEDLEGGAGADTFTIQVALAGDLRGGAGADTFVFSDSGDVNEVDGGADTDTLRVTGDTAHTYTVASAGNTLERGDTTIADFSNVEDLAGDRGADIFNIEIAHTGVLSGGAGSDEFNLAAVVTGRLDGVDGVDTFTLQSGAGVRRAPGGGNEPLVSTFIGSLIYEGWSEPVTVTLAGQENGVGFSGTATGLMAANGSNLDASGFMGITSLNVGGTSTSDTLQGIDLESGQFAAFVLGLNTGNSVVRDYFYLERRTYLSFQGIDIVRGGSGEGKDTLGSGFAVSRYEVDGVGQGRLCQPRCDGDDPKDVWSFSGIEVLRSQQEVATLALRVPANTAEARVILSGELPDVSGFQGSVEVAATQSASRSFWLEFEGINEVIGASGAGRNVLRNELMSGGSRVLLEDRRGTTAGSGSIRYTTTGAALSYTGFGERQLFVLDVGSLGAAVTVTLSGRDTEGYSGRYSTSDVSGTFTKSLGVRGRAEGGDTLITELTGASAWNVVEAGNSYNNGGLIYSFVAMENLQGGGGVDTFTIGFAHSGNLVGGAGDDIFNLNAAVTGEVQGGAGADTFTLSSGACVLSSGNSCSDASPSLGTISGGADQDSLSRSLETTYLLAATAGAGSLEGIADFGGIERLQGGAESNKLSLESISTTGADLVQVTFTGTPDGNGFSGSVTVATVNWIEFVGVNEIVGNAANASRNALAAGGLILQSVSDGVNGSIRYSASIGLAYENFGVLAGFMLDLGSSGTKIAVTLTSPRGSGFDGTYVQGETTVLFMGSPGIAGTLATDDMLQLTDGATSGGRFVVTGVGSGSYLYEASGSESSFSFSGIEILQGSGSEMLVGSGTAVGAGGTNVASEYRLTALGTGSLHRGSSDLMSFRDVRTLIAGSAEDTLDLTAIDSTTGENMLRVTLQGSPSAPSAAGYSGTLQIDGESATLSFVDFDVLAGREENSARNVLVAEEGLSLTDSGNNSVLYVDGEGTDRVLRYSNFGEVDGFSLVLMANVVRVNLAGLATRLGFSGELYDSEGMVLRRFTNSPGVRGVAGGSHLLEVGFEVAGTFTISGVDTGSYRTTSGNVASFSFAQIGSLSGGAGAERFMLAAEGALSGSVAGGAGVDQLETEGSVAVDFTLSAAGAGNLVSGARAFSFSGVEHLTGGSGANSLSYSGVSEAVTVTLEGRGALVGFQGEGTFLAGFANISQVVGGGGTADRLVGNLSGGGIFTLSGSGEGNYEESREGGARRLDFSAFENLSGGAGDDTFRVLVGGSVSGELSGGGGTDVLDLSRVTSPLWLVELSGVTASPATELPATGFSGKYGLTTLIGSIGSDLVFSVNILEDSNSVSFAGIDEVRASDVRSSGGGFFLQGTNAGGRWSLDGSYTGSYTSLETKLSFRNARQVQGGTGTDILDVSAIAGPSTIFLGPDDNSLLDPDDNSQTTPSYRGNAVRGASDSVVAEDNTEVLVPYRGIERYAGGESAYLVVAVLADDEGRSIEGKNLVVNPLETPPAEGRPSDPVLLSLTQDENGERLQTLDEFLGPVLIGGTLFPAEVLESGEGNGEGELPLALRPSLGESNSAARMRRVAIDTLRVEGALETRGDLYLAASRIELAGDLAAGTETPGELASAAGSARKVVLVAVGEKPVDAQAGTVPGDIAVLLADGETDRTIYTGSGTLIANRGINGASSLVLNFGGGILRTAVSPRETRSSNPSLQSQVRPEGLTTLLRNYLSVLDLDAQEFVVILFNPTTQLSTVIGRLYLDLGLFVEELSLYGLEGAGLALFYSQCEEVEGCAPEITLEKLEELIARLEERLAGGLVLVTGLDREVLDLRLRRAQILRKELRLFLGLDAPEGVEEEEELDFEEFDLPSASLEGAGRG